MRVERPTCAGAAASEEDGPGACAGAIMDSAASSLAGASKGASAWKSAGCLGCGGLAVHPAERTLLSASQSFTKQRG